MTPMDLEREIKTGKLRPVYLVTGDERFLADIAVRSLRSAALDGGVADFNEDQFTAGEADIDRVLSAAKMVPMMSPRRFVLVRGIERWEPRGQQSGDRPSAKVGPLDRLAEYADKPVDSTCMVITTPKIDARRKLLLAAKKANFIVACEALDLVDLARWIEHAAKRRGNPISSDVARVLAQVAGPELGYVNDAVERLSLFVGPSMPITEDAVSEIVVRVRETSVFTLISAVGARDLRRALAALGEVFDPRDGGIGLVALLAWSIRQLLRFAVAVQAGSSLEDAALAAGAQGFKGRDLHNQTRGLPVAELERWLVLLAEADLSLKGSKRPARAVLDTLVMAMAGGRAA
jgi:DNA polymerase III subunit delta